MIRPYCGLTANAHWPARKLKTPVPPTATTVAQAAPFQPHIGVQSQLSARFTPAIVNTIALSTAVFFFKCKKLIDQ